MNSALNVALAAARDYYPNGAYADIQALADVIKPHIEALAAGQAEPERPREFVKMTLTAAALDRLIGKDAEFEMLLTHSSVKEVISRHLDTLRGQVDKAVADAIGVAFGSYYGTRFSLSGAASNAIHAQLGPIVNGAVQNYFVQNKDIISGLVKNALEAGAASAIKREVDKRLELILIAARSAIPKEETL